MELVDKSYVNDAKNEGLITQPWTVNTRVDIIRMVELGVNGIFTNYPEKAKKIYKSLQKKQNSYNQ